MTKKAKLVSSPSSKNKSNNPSSSTQLLQSEGQQTTTSIQGIGSGGGSVWNLANDSITSTTTSAMTPVPAAFATLGEGAAAAAGTSSSSSLSPTPTSSGGCFPSVGHLQRQQLSLWSQGHLDDLRQIRDPRQHLDLLGGGRSGGVLNHPQSTTSSSLLSMLPPSAAASTSILGAQQQLHHQRQFQQHELPLSTTQTSPEDEIAQAVSQLSLVERQKVYHDVYGAANVDSSSSSSRIDDDIEDPDMIQRCLQQFEDELAKLMSPQQQTHQIQSQPSNLLHVATSQNPLYVHDKSIQLSFIRAENYIPQAAVTRFIGYLQEKMKLFGIEKLTKEITIADLNTGDIRCLESGCFQIVPTPDKLGRRIMINFRSLQQQMQFTHENILRVLYYMTMSLVKDNAKVQRQGTVDITYHIGCQIDFDTQFRRKEIMLRSVLPIKVAALHGCADDPTVRFIVKLLRTVINLHTFCRLQIHFGNHIEVQYDLMYYGIPVSALPIGPAGIVSTDNHKSWVEERRRVDQHLSQAAAPSSSTPAIASAATPTAKLPPNQPDNDVVHPPMSPASSVGSASSKDVAAAASTKAAGQTAAASKSGEVGSTAATSSKPLRIMEPNPNDCLLGRGKAIDQHLGNCQFRYYVEHHPTLVRAYWNAPKSLKRRIVEQMRLDLQRDLGLRFLKEQEDGQYWQLADDDAIRHKISRTLRRILQKRQEAQEKLRQQQLGQFQQPSL